MTRILVTFALAVYNNVANLWPPFNRAAYVPANVAAAAALGVVSTTALGLSAADLGLTDLSAFDLAVGAAIGAVVGGAVLALGHTERGAKFIADRRVAGLGGKMLAYQMFVRVPFGTALLEEFAFRGVLFASWRDEGVVAAAVISSAVFGLWHVMPSSIMVRTNKPGASRRTIARTIVLTVLGTSAVGMGLVWLRLETGSIVAPFAVHATVNSLATLAGVLAARRVAAA